MDTIGQRIREIRKSRNLTQRELADRVGINFTYLSRVENDRLDDEQTPREETIQRIAKALHTDPDVRQRSKMNASNRREYSS